MPPLPQWVTTFGAASVVSIAGTFFLLRRVASRHLKGPLKADAENKPLSREGRRTLFGIAFLAVVLMTASAMNLNLGAPACAAGVLVATVVSLTDRSTWRDLGTGVAWSVLPLVAGLFVIVEALNGAGALHAAVASLDVLHGWQPRAAGLTAGFAIAGISNLMNNLPSGLITAAAVKSAHTCGTLRDAVLVGVDLGPNLSVTGSLATILWLIAIRRDGLQVGFWDFLKWGAMVMPPVLALAILVLR
jgi:arsenical pump membrane protein